MQSLLMVSAVVPSILLVWYFRARDAYPEPARVLWATFFLGVLTVIPVLIVAMPVARAIKDVADPNLAGFLQAFLTAAGPEELFKFAVVSLYCARHREFDEPMDGIVYGAVASLGFATLENILYVTSSGLGVAIMRAILAVPGHAFMGAIMGYFVGQAKFRPAERTKLLALGYFVPFVLHGLYDWPLLAMKAGSEPAHAGTSDGLLLLLPITLATFVFEWVWTVRLVTRLREQQRAWAQQTQGSGPFIQQPTPAQHAPFATPYTVAPQWAPPPPPSTGSPVVGALWLVLGVLFSITGGTIGLACLVTLLFGPTDGPDSASAGSLIVSGILVGGLPLAFGLFAFIRGIARLNRA
jgi:RsiW-degrading membrane proteinase PrsW (M82 family)